MGCVHTHPILLLQEAQFIPPLRVALFGAFFFWLAPYSFYYNILRLSAFLEAPCYNTCSLLVWVFSVALALFPILFAYFNEFIKEFLCLLTFSVLVVWSYFPTPCHLFLVPCHFLMAFTTEPRICLLMGDVFVASVPLTEP